MNRILMTMLCAGTLGVFGCSSTTVANESAEPSGHTAAPAPSATNALPTLALAPSTSAAPAPAAEAQPAQPAMSGAFSNLNTAAVDDDGVPTFEVTGSKFAIPAPAPAPAPTGGLSVNARPIGDAAPRPAPAPISTAASPSAASGGGEDGPTFDLSGATVSASGTGGATPSPAPSSMLLPSVPGSTIDTTKPSTEAGADKATAAAEAATEATVPGVQTDEATKALIKLAQGFLAKQEQRTARTALTQALYGTISSADEESVLATLDTINRAIFMSAEANGDLTTVIVKKGDSLEKLAKASNTNWQMLRRINGLASNLIRIGDKLKVPKGTFSLGIRKGKFTADLLLGGDFVKRYKIGTGKNDKTPEGDFKISNRIENPDDNGVKAGEPGNRLGTHWMALEGKTGYEGYGIHGCKVEQYNELGTQCSEGCIRLTNEDVGELHDILPVGTKVTIAK